MKRFSNLFTVIFALLFGVLFVSNVFADAPNEAGFGTQTAWQNPQQNMGEGQSKPGYARIMWEPGKVMPVRLRDGMVTLINLPSWEKITDAYIGDKDFFDGRPIDKNVFLISPVDGRSVADTNMIIFGKSGNKYVFYLKSEPINAETVTNSEIDIIVPSSLQGKAGGAAAAAAGFGGVGATSSSSKSNLTSMIAKAKTSGSGDTPWEGEDFGWIKNIPVDPSEFRFDLDIYVPNPDDYVIAPERVWRDKIFTYIDFGEKALQMNQRPVVSILVEGGEAPVGFRTEGPLSRLIVVEAIGDFVLRSGQRIVCIKKRSKPFLASSPTINTSYTLPKINRVGAGGAAGVVGNGAPISNPNQNYNFYNAQAPVQGGAMQQGGMSMNMMTSNAAMYSQQGTMVAGQQAGGQRYIEKNVPRTSGSYLPDHYVPLVEQKNISYAVELAKGYSIDELEASWAAMTGGKDNKNNFLSQYEDQVFYSLETEGVDELGSNQYHGSEVYRLRIGPFPTIDTPDDLCKKLAGYKINCKVVRVQ